MAELVERCSRHAHALVTRIGSLPGAELVWEPAINQGLVRFGNDQRTDAVIAAIRASDDRPAARAALMAEPFSLSEPQAEHILDMTLGRLTRLGRTQLEEELAKLREEIAELEAILADDTKLRGVIATEMTAIREKYANPRRSIITHDTGEMGVEDLIDDLDQALAIL